ncbi:ClpXP protease specificity-enhancing factor SspB [Enhygromyxa salina]|uniref:Stringent starvation protein B n=1 Tax=Enhygromyxa salina TaxID=215803 RepID=A0A2S9YWP2_9BACT|nr:ClpXP protease specificity-enhancing factor SspB [Enhygromyxa salina]PRQ09510.1 Stringent starvation protein B [Enhygromyxa salina]
MQPVQSAIESLQAKGQCPRLHVNVTHEDAVCPDFVREKWTQRLIIDLDPSYPLELEFTEIGVEANLSFGGYVTRCTFPWVAIYIVAERDTGRGRVFEQNIPASLRAELTPTPAGVDPKLTKARDEERGRGTSRRKRRGSAKPPAVFELAAVEQSPADEEPETETETETETQPEPRADQQEVKTRRAAFTVIDGGS